MNEQTVIDICVKSMIVAIKVGSPALLAIMLTGLIVSILQAATQIHEQTLSFIPKVIAMTLVIMITGPWILRTFVFFTKNMLQSLPNITSQ